MSHREPSGQTVPPVSSFRRAGSLKITSRCAAGGGGVVTQECYACPLPAPNPRRLHLPRQLAGHPARQPQPLHWFSRVAGWGARYARGDMSSRGGRASAATGDNGTGSFPKCFPPVAIVALCAHAPHGWAIVPHGGRPPMGHGPFGCPQIVWRAISKLVVSCRQVIQRLAIVAARHQLTAKRVTGSDWFHGCSYVASASMRSGLPLVKNRQISKPSQLSYTNRVGFRCQQIPQTVGGVIAAVAILVGIHLQQIFRPVGIMQ